MRRLLPGALRAGGVVASTVLLVACSSGTVDVVMPAGAEPLPQCVAVVADLPDTVLGQDRRDIAPADAPAAAWGDPPIVLRCGVAKPSELQRDSSCAVINDIGWLTSQNGVALDLTTPPDKDVTFTTIGRSVYVEVTVPAAWIPHQVDALVDVSASVAGNTREVEPCV